MDKDATGNDPIKVIVDKDLETLIPGFLQRRREDLEKLREALQAQDVEVLRVTGHSMKGTGGGYGFDRLSALGAAIESSAKGGDLQDIREQVDLLENYLDHLQVEFASEP